MCFNCKYLRFENLFKSILIKSNLINEMTTQLGQQMKNSKSRSKSRNKFCFAYQFEMQTLT